MDALSLAIVSQPDVEIAGLLQAHFDLMRATSPAESCHVMAPDDVFNDAAVVMTARQDGALVGIGALKSIDARHGELKSMHTAAAARGKGVASALLCALISQAVVLGHRRLSLETGSMAEFASARALYARHGFVECPPFGDYALDPLSTFMTKDL